MAGRFSTHFSTQHEGFSTQPAQGLKRARSGSPGSGYLPRKRMRVGPNGSNIHDSPEGSPNLRLREDGYESYSAPSSTVTSYVWPLASPLEVSSSLGSGDDVREAPPPRMTDSNTPESGVRPSETGALPPTLLPDHPSPTDDVSGDSVPEVSRQIKGGLDGRLICPLPKSNAFTTEPDGSAPNIDHPQINPMAYDIPYICQEPTPLPYISPNLSSIGTLSNSDGMGRPFNALPLHTSTIGRRTEFQYEVPEVSTAMHAYELRFQPDEKRPVATQASPPTSLLDQPSLPDGLPGDSISQTSTVLRACESRSQPDEAEPVTAQFSPPTFLLNQPPPPDGLSGGPVSQVCTASQASESRSQLTDAEPMATPALPPIFLLGQLSLPDGVSDDSVLEMSDSTTQTANLMETSSRASDLLLQLSTTGEGDIASREFSNHRPELAGQVAAATETVEASMKSQESTGHPYPSPNGTFALSHGIATTAHVFGVVPSPTAEVPSFTHVGDASPVFPTTPHEPASAAPLLQDCSSFDIRHTLVATQVVVISDDETVDISDQEMVEYTYSSQDDFCTNDSDGSSSSSEQSHSSMSVAQEDTRATSPFRTAADLASEPSNPHLVPYSNFQPDVAVSLTSANEDVISTLLCQVKAPDEQGASATPYDSSSNVRSGCHQFDCDNTEWTYTFSSDSELDHVMESDQDDLSGQISRQPASQSVLCPDIDEETFGDTESNDDDDFDYEGNDQGDSGMTSQEFNFSDNSFYDDTPDDRERHEADLNGDVKMANNSHMFDDGIQDDGERLETCSANNVEMAHNSEYMFDDDSEYYPISCEDDAQDGERQETYSGNDVEMDHSAEFVIGDDPGDYRIQEDGLTGIDDNHMNLDNSEPSPGPSSVNLEKGRATMSLYDGVPDSETDNEQNLPAHLQADTQGSFVRDVADTGNIQELSGDTQAGGESSFLRPDASPTSPAEAPAHRQIEELLSQVEALGLTRKVEEILASSQSLEAYVIVGILHELVGHTPQSQPPASLADGETPSAISTPKASKQKHVDQSGPYRRPARRPKRKNLERKHIREALVRLAFPNNSPIYSINPQQIKAFEQGRANGPSADSFGLELCSKGRWTKWNKRALDVFVLWFSEEYGGTTPESVIRDTFRTYLKTLQEKYYQLHPTATALQVMVEDRRNGRRRKASSRSELRLEQLFLRNRNFKGWENLIPAYHILTPEMMSGDETDLDNAGKFMITRPTWRSKELEDFLRHLGALYISSRYLNNGKYSAGEFPAPRYDSRRPDTIYQQAPVGLPVNWYNRTWLNAEPHRRESLQVKPPLKLTIPEDHLKLAKRFLCVKTRADRPLPS
ncbi:hypothetical protein AAF712_010910 [Marasmius tenuissimus]|uniref:Uncharacterized protein n=1 Tax=Marasmius tenuissimus TaxID=585030 RepID=A0ABR2ZLH3_9AGAR